VVNDPVGPVLPGAPVPVSKEQPVCDMPLPFVVDQLINEVLPELTTDGVAVTVITGALLSESSVRNGKKK